MSVTLRYYVVYDLQTIYGSSHPFLSIAGGSSNRLTLDSTRHLNDATAPYFRTETHPGEKKTERKNRAVFLKPTISWAYASVFRARRRIFRARSKIRTGGSRCASTFPTAGLQGPTKSWVRTCGQGGAAGGTYIAQRRERESGGGGGRSQRVRMRLVNLVAPRDQLSAVK